MVENAQQNQEEKLKKGDEKMKKLKFYNVKTKESFWSSAYTIKMKKGRRFAIAKNKGTSCWRLIAKKFKP